MSSLPQSQLSKFIGRMWKEESEDVLRTYEYRANIFKTEHAEKYPDYVFRPRKKADKERMREERKAQREAERTNQKRLRSLRRSAPIPSQNPEPPFPPPPFSSATDASSEVSPDGIDRLLDFGPSPPISQAPSPNSSPNSSLLSLDSSSEAEASTSKQPLKQAVPSTAGLSPLALVGVLHKVAQSGPYGAIDSRENAPSGSSAVAPGWQSTQEQIAVDRHALSPVAGPSRLPQADASPVTQRENAPVAEPQCTDASGLQLNGASAYQGVFGEDMFGYLVQHSGQSGVSILVSIFPFIFF